MKRIARIYTNSLLVLGLLCGSFIAAPAGAEAAPRVIAPEKAVADGRIATKAETMHVAGRWNAGAALLDFARRILPQLEAYRDDLAARFGAPAEGDGGPVRGLALYD